MWEKKKLRNKERVWVEINKQALLNNVASIRSVIGKEVDLWAVVKSNAYGHGLETVKIIQNKVEGLAVDNVKEGVVLRDRGVKIPILVLGSILKEELDLAVKNSLIVTVSNKEVIKYMNKLKKIPDWHMKIDTGMHRRGFLPMEVKEVISSLSYKEAGKLKGIYSHLATATEINNGKAKKQLDEFYKVVEENNLSKLYKHLAASGGTLMGREYHLDGVRVGMALYGYFPANKLARQLENRVILKPVLKWKTVVTEIKKINKGQGISYDLTEKMKKDSIVAVLPIGYWHGLPRDLSGKGEFIVKGKKAKILGRVTMDMTMVDVTNIGGVRLGEIAEVDIASAFYKINTIPYEFLTRINPLIKRVYV